MDQRLERILPRVQKPARYTGGEYRQIIKDKAEVDLRLAFCFPDIYEIGMSNIGMRILYATMNQMPGVWCERVFAPWGDMEQEMRKAGIPLYALESGDPVSDFDVVAFSLGYEMAYPRRTQYARPRRHPAAQRRPSGADAAGHGGRHGVQQPRADGTVFRSHDHR